MPEGRCSGLLPESGAGAADPVGPPLRVCPRLPDTERLLQELVRDEPDRVLREDLERVRSPPVVEAAEPLLAPNGGQGIELPAVGVALHLHAAADGVERVADGGGDGAGAGSQQEVGRRRLLPPRVAVDDGLEQVVGGEVEGRVRRDPDQRRRQALVEGPEALGADHRPDRVHGASVLVVGERQAEADGVEGVRQRRRRHPGAGARQQPPRDGELALLSAEDALVLVVGRKLCSRVGEDADDVGAVPLPKR
mmetsp:Transcript_33268/g.78892  ORF Transcript_33268/g.78892 Transcript_33268/m.78892 type:complete len:251 (-) Transcript_33268:316-1068(-)